MWLSPSRVMKGGMNTEEPVAMMKYSEVTVLSPTATVWASTKEACPSSMATLFPRSRPLTPFTRVLTTAFFRAWRAFMSTPRAAGSMPVTAYLAASFASERTLAVLIRVLVGMQPTFRQVPPK